MEADSRDETVAGAWRPWIGLALGAFLLAYSLLFTTLAPGGTWANRIAGNEMWSERDPGGWYLASAHELFSERHARLYPGHPGLPMQLVLHSVQYALFVVEGGAAHGLTFTEHTARQIGAVWWLSKLASSAVHLLGLFLVYCLARRGLASARAAMIAALAYGTSFPVLFFVSRVSVEPWVVVCFCLAFLAIESVEDAVATGRTARLVGWASVAAAAAVSGLLAKIHLLGLFPFYCVGLLMVGRPTSRDAARSSRGLRILTVAVFLVAGAAIAVSSSALMDWSDFLEFWRAQADPTVADTQLLPSGEWSTVVSNRVGLVWSRFSLGAYWPRADKRGVFALCELPFVAVSLVGLALLARRWRDRRAFWAPALYALPTVGLWYFRSHGLGWVGFHYLFLVLVVLAIAYGHALDRLLVRLKSPSLPLREGLAVVLTLVLHTTALWAATDSRVRDVAKFRERKLGAVYRALSVLGPGERLLVVGSLGQDFHGVADTYAAPGHPSILLREIEARLVREATISDAERTPEVLARQGIVRVLDLRGTEPLLLSVREWTLAASGR